MKIGILTYHRSHNYGAFLQAFALCTRLRKEGFDAEIIDFTMPRAQRVYAEFMNQPLRRKLRRFRRYRFQLAQYRMFEDAAGMLPLSTARCASDAAGGFQAFARGRYDLVIAGSDEIWKLDQVRGFPNPYWLIDDTGARKISYAASGRSDISRLSPEERGVMRGALSGYDYIGVRDQCTADMAVELTGQPGRVHVCCDPTFAHDFNPDPARGRALLERRYGVAPGKPCIGFMAHYDADIDAALKERFGARAEFVALYEHHAKVRNLPGLTPFEWIDVVAALDFLVTFYFHGTCFAIQCGTPFFAVDMRSDSAYTSKIADLLGRTGLADRCRLGRTGDKGIAAMLGFCEAALQGGGTCDFTQAVAMERARFNPFPAVLRGETGATGTR